MRVTLPDASACGSSVGVSLLAVVPQAPGADWDIDICHQKALILAGGESPENTGYLRARTACTALRMGTTRSSTIHGGSGTVETQLSKPITNTKVGSQTERPFPLVPWPERWGAGLVGEGEGWVPLMKIALQT